MKFNKDTKLEHLPLHKLAFYEHGEEVHVLIRDDEDGRYVVASFDRHGYCNNASSYLLLAEAWKFMIGLIQDCLGIDPLKEERRRQRKILGDPCKGVKAGAAGLKEMLEHGKESEEVIYSLYGGLLQSGPAEQDQPQE